ncbi:hypothetical protein [Luteimicrobium subarcticum]|uniref:Uncharacterized protein n=1 Tax=Luteimicrobium subarcticum TaxID=620910 RepID=A0A2M8WIZ3_9MICO|nr:hypothetical protein [Luteimicrobium subarcticum]PJI90907.1 hypothetical protein CLV34_2163 [Luteimicrobium subarcticum]
MTQPSTDAPARYSLAAPAGATRCVAVELGARHVRVLLGDLDGHVVHDRSTRFPVDTDPIGAARHAQHALAEALVRDRAGTGRHSSIDGHITGGDVVTLDDVAAVVVARRDRAADAARIVATTLLRVPGAPAAVVVRAVDLAAQAEHRAASATDAAWGASADRSSGHHPVLHVDIDHGVETTLLLDPDRAACPSASGAPGHGAVPRRLTGAEAESGRATETLPACEDHVRRAAGPDATRHDLRRAGVALGIALAREATRTGAHTIVLDGRLGSASGTLTTALRATFAEHTTGGAVLREARLARRAAVLGALDLATRIAAVRLTTPA